MSEGKRKRRMVVRTAKLEMPEPYDGWWAVARTNMPVSEYRQIFVGEQDDRYRMLAKQITKWNYVDDDGEAIPTTFEGVLMLPMDLIALTMQALDEQVASFLEALRKGP